MLKIIDSYNICQGCQGLRAGLSLKFIKSVNSSITMDLSQWQPDFNPKLYFMEDIHSFIATQMGVADASSKVGETLKANITI